jgi:HEAT repeat protein
VTVRWAFVVLVVHALAASVAADKAVRSPEELLRAYGVKSTTPELIGALRDPRAIVRENAAAELGRQKATPAIPALRAALEDRYVYARLAAAESLGMMGDEAGLPVLRAALQDPDSAIRLRASGALVRLGNGEGYAAVIQILNDRGERPLRRVLAVRELAAFLKQDATRQAAQERLRTVLLMDEQVEARRAAAEALGKVDEPAVKEAFARAVNDGDPIVSALARRALGRAEEKPRF